MDHPTGALALEERRTTKLSLPRREQDEEIHILVPLFLPHTLPVPLDEVNQPLEGQGAHGEQTADVSVLGHRAGWRWS